ncbi:MAG: glycosyltransferase family 9 protein [Candidatus Omnitrophica bacterium]|nr:glycosyltransferase family 9 protein [Candidatus Omnitrophota bacterium]
MDFYQVKDYPKEVFEHFARRKRYLRLQEAVKTIVFHKPGAGLGDLVLCIPVLRALKKMFPSAKLYFFGSYNSVYDSIFKAIPYIDGFISNVEPGKKELFKGFSNFFRKYFKKFDLIVSGQSKFKPSLRLWSLFPVIYISRNPFFSRWKILDFRFYKKRNVHVVSQMAAPIKVLGAGDIDYSPAIEISEQYLFVAKTYLANFSGPFISILPASGNFHRNWDEDKYAALSDKLIEMGYNIILVGNEKDILVRIKEKMQANPLIPFLEEERFGQDPIYSIGLLKFSRLAVGSDGGGVHLASLAGCPVVALYGPNTPIKWGPLGRENVVIYKDLECSPCRYVHMKELKECESDRKCLRSITVDEVMDAVNFILENTNPR